MAEPKLKPRFSDVKFSAFSLMLINVNVTNVNAYANTKMNTEYPDHEFMGY